MLACGPLVGQNRPADVILPRPRPRPRPHHLAAFLSLGWEATRGAVRPLGTGPVRRPLCLPHGLHWRRHQPNQTFKREPKRASTLCSPPRGGGPALPCRLLLFAPKRQQCDDSTITQAAALLPSQGRGPCPAVPCSAAMLTTLLNEDHDHVSRHWMIGGELPPPASCSCRPRSPDGELNARREAEEILLNVDRLIRSDSSHCSRLIFLHGSFRHPLTVPAPAQQGHRHCFCD
nr:unnamed protein product [Digitaria exilis]